MPSSEVLHKWKTGKLHSGSKTGPKVKSQKQALAIMFSEKRAEAKHGGKYPEKRQAGGALMSALGFGAVPPSASNPFGQAPAAAPPPPMAAPPSANPQAMQQAVVANMSPVAQAGMNAAGGPMASTGVAPAMPSMGGGGNGGGWRGSEPGMGMDRPRPQMGPGVMGPLQADFAKFMPNMQMPISNNVMQAQSMQNQQNQPQTNGVAGGWGSGPTNVTSPRPMADGGVADSNFVPSSAEEANAKRWSPKDPNNLTAAEQNILLSPAYNPAGWTPSIQDKTNSSNSPLGPLRAAGGVAQPGVGNFNMAKQATVTPSPMMRSEERNVMHGPVMSAVPGRTDAHRTAVPSGSYVVPADIVSGRGQGNTMAGMNVLQRMFKMGPYGSAPGGLRPGRTMPHAMAAPKMQSIMGARGGGKQSGHVGKPTPVHLAGGELVVPPANVLETVRRITKNPTHTLSTAHNVLDKWVVRERKKLRKTLGKLPPPVKD